MFFEKRFPNRLWIVICYRLTSGRIDQCGIVGKPDFKKIAEFSNSTDSGTRRFNRIGLLNGN